MKKSTTCKKCGLVSFATTDVCKRCGAKLEPVVIVLAQSAALQEPAKDKSRRHTILFSSQSSHSSANIQLDDLSFTEPRVVATGC